MYKKVWFTNTIKIKLVCVSTWVVAYQSTEQTPIEFLSRVEYQMYLQWWPETATRAVIKYQMMSATKYQCCHTSIYASDIRITCSWLYTYKFTNNK